MKRTIKMKIFLPISIQNAVNDRIKERKFNKETTPWLPEEWYGIDPAHELLFLLLGNYRRDYTVVTDFRFIEYKVEEFHWSPSTEEIFKFFHGKCGKEELIKVHPDLNIKTEFVGLLHSHTFECSKERYTFDKDIYNFYFKQLPKDFPYLKYKRVKANRYQCRPDVWCFSISDLIFTSRFTNDKMISVLYCEVGKKYIAANKVGEVKIKWYD